MGATDLPRPQNALNTRYSGHGVTPFKNVLILAKFYKISQSGDFTAEGEFAIDMIKLTTMSRKNTIALDWHCRVSCAWSVSAFDAAKKLLTESTLSAS